MFLGSRGHERGFVSTLSSDLKSADRRHGVDEDEDRRSDILWD